MTEATTVDQRDVVLRLCGVLGGYLLKEQSQNPVSLDDEMVRLAKGRHRITPLLYKAANASGDCDTHSPLMKELYSRYQHNGARVITMQSVENDLRDSFDLASIPFAFVKGQLLAEQIYDGPASRTAKDVDILVSPSDLPASLAVMLEQGYVLQDSRSKKLLGTNFFGPRAYARLFKDITLIHPVSNVQVELHERLFHLEPKGYSAAVLSSANDRNAPPIHDPHYLLYLILHGALVHWPRLKMIVDLVLLMQAIPASKALECLKLAERFGSDAAFVASLEFAEILFPGTMPEPWRAVVRDSKCPEADRQKFRGAFEFALTNGRASDDRQPPNSGEYWKLAQHIFPKHISNRQIFLNGVIGSIAIRF